jgi:hypothetical protein
MFLPTPIEFLMEALPLSCICRWASDVDATAYVDFISCQFKSGRDFATTWYVKKDILSK